jgi:hypothetical protein
MKIGMFSVALARMEISPVEYGAYSLDFHHIANAHVAQTAGKYFSHSTAFLRH